MRLNSYCFGVGQKCQWCYSLLNQASPHYIALTSIITLKCHHNYGACVTKQFAKHCIFCCKGIFSKSLLLNAWRRYQKITKFCDGLYWPKNWHKKCNSECTHNNRNKQTNANDQLTMLRIRLNGCFCRVAFHTLDWTPITRIPYELKVGRSNLIKISTGI